MHERQEAEDWIRTYVGPVGAIELAHARSWSTVLRVPLATHTGWTSRHADIGGEGHFIPLLGAAIPFPATAADAALHRSLRNAQHLRYLLVIHIFQITKYDGLPQFWRELA